MWHVNAALVVAFITLFVAMTRGAGGRGDRRLQAGGVGTVRQYSHFAVADGDTVPGHHTERFANRPVESERGTAEVMFQRFREARAEA